MAGNIITPEEGAEMGNVTLHRLIEYLKAVKGWTDAEIVALLSAITAK